MSELAVILLDHLFDILMIFERRLSCTWNYSNCEMVAGAPSSFSSLLPTRRLLINCLGHVIGELSDFDKKKLNRKIIHFNWIGILAF